MVTKKTTVTVPLHIIKNRPFIDANFLINDHPPRKARCWLDTGGGAVIITEPLAQALGVAYKPHQSDLVPTRLASLAIDDMLLDLSRIPTFVASGQQTIQGEEGIEAFFGAQLLSQFYLIFDYPQHQFTLITPEYALRSSGLAVPLSIHPSSHFPRVEVQIGGAVYGMLLDTGASQTMASRAVLDGWISQTSNILKAVTGSKSLDAMPATTGEIAACISQLQWGPYPIHDVEVVSRPAGVFERTLSQMMSGPVIGALAGDVLSQFRCEIDYVASRLYLHRTH